jgi:hypothetical protein
MMNKFSVYIPVHGQRDTVVAQFDGRRSATVLDHIVSSQTAAANSSEAEVCSIAEDFAWAKALRYQGEGHNDILEVDGAYEFFDDKYEDGPVGWEVVLYSGVSEE